MDPSPLQRRITFGLIVVVLAGLAAYLVSTAARGSAEPAAAPGRSTPATMPDSGPPSADITPSAGPESQATPNIYQWLPFTPSGLAAATSVTREFGAAYGTFSYAENGAGYVASLKPLVSQQLVSQIEIAYSAPGVAAARSAAKQVSVGTASIQSLRSFGPTSLTFVVEVSESMTSVAGRTQNATAYAVTVAGAGTTWRVTDVELAGAGNS